jgi:CCR4-NOT transcription complex subunit 4
LSRPPFACLRFFVNKASGFLQSRAKMSSATDELPECPLCMEVFELDDINFFPCTCGYQICRFCWHRLRTDENGLCPACRKSYPEDPAQFKPLTDEEVHKIKKERRQKETQRKQKSAENRKHLANVRVVQKNLVFVVGLPPRLTDTEVLKRPEFFGRFGKIHKVVINQSTSYVGSQGPSASAYVTYVRPEDALTAIKIVNNAQVDGRIIKASLGTTKYCSHFLKGTQCMKPDCMYLHDLGDDAASFTKEEIQQGKHVQYEQKLADQYLSSTHATNSVSETGVKAPTKAKETSPPSSGQLSPTIQSLMELSSTNSCEGPEMPAVCHPPPQQQQQQQSPRTTSPMPNGINEVAPTQLPSATVISSSCSSGVATPPPPPPPPPPPAPSSSSCLAQSSCTGPTVGARPLPFGVSPSDHLSLFSDTGFLCNRNFKPVVEPTAGSTPPEGLLAATADRLKATNNNSSTDWQENTDAQDDDLGFDPYVISAKGLADMIEKEKACNSIMQSSHHHHLNCRPVINSQMLVSTLRSSKVLPPGFAPHPPQQQQQAPNGYIQHHPSNANHIVQQQSSKMLNFMQLSSGVTSAVSGPPPPHAHHLFGPDQILFGPPRKHDPGLLYHPMQSTIASHQQSNSAFNLQEWQDGLKALLPNINISFGTQSLPSSQREFGSGPSGLNSRPVIPMNPMQGYPSVGEKSWCSSSSLASHSMPDLSWDPAIINTGAVTEAATGLEEPPHWMASLHHLTDDHGTAAAGPSLNLLMHPSHSMSWLQQPPSAAAAAAAARFPPPGFNNSATSRQLMTDKQNLTDQKLNAS